MSYLLEVIKYIIGGIIGIIGFVFLSRELYFIWEQYIFAEPIIKYGTLYALIFVIGLNIYFFLIHTKKIKNNYKLFRQYIFRSKDTIPGEFNIIKAKIKSFEVDTTTKRSILDMGYNWKITTEGYYLGQNQIWSGNFSYGLLNISADLANKFMYGGNRYTVFYEEILAKKLVIDQEIDVYIQTSDPSIYYIKDPFEYEKQISRNINKGNFQTQINEITKIEPKNILITLLVVVLIVIISTLVFVILIKR